MYRVETEAASITATARLATRDEPFPSEAPPAAEPSDLEGVSPELYTALRQIARRQLFRLGRPATLCTTALVNESYLKLAEGQGHVCGPGHFLATMSRVMRHVLIDHARERGAERRGGDQVQVSLGHIDSIAATPCDVAELMAIDAALLRMRALDPRLEKVTEMRLFGGFSVSEIADELGVSAPTIKRELRAARAFLGSELALGGAAAPGPMV